MKAQLAAIAPSYLALRRAHPLIPASEVAHYLLSGADCTLEQFTCRHDWAIDESSDRCYCLNGCGLDGDG